MDPTDPNPDQKPPTVLELIDQAEAAARQAVLACRNKLARDHFEFALALIRESWIAEDGQEARSAAQVVAGVQEAMDIFAAVFNRKGGA